MESRGSGGGRSQECVKEKDKKPKPDDCRKALKKATVYKHGSREQHQKIFW